MSILPRPGSVRALVDTLPSALRGALRAALGEAIQSRGVGASWSRERATRKQRWPGFVRVAAQVCALMLVALTSTSSAARAQEIDASRAPPPAALDHYNRGRAHYQGGRYREAVQELELALRLDPDSPNLVYNLARVHELLGDIEPAIGYYERYGSMLPPDEQEERQRVAGVIERLRGAKRQVVRPPVSPPPLRPPNVKLERGVADGAFWTVTTLSLAALAAGGVTGALALRDERAVGDFVLGDDGNYQGFRRLIGRSNRLALAADASFAAGAVTGLTAILMYALRTRPVLEPSVSLVPGGFGFTLRGRL